MQLYNTVPHMSKARKNGTGPPGQPVKNKVCRILFVNFLNKQFSIRVLGCFLFFFTECRRSLPVRRGKLQLSLHEQLGDI